MERGIKVIELGNIEKFEEIGLNELSKVKGGLCIKWIDKPGNNDSCGVRIGGVKWCFKKHVYTNQAPLPHLDIPNPCKIRG